MKETFETMLSNRIQELETFKSELITRINQVDGAIAECYYLVELSKKQQDAEVLPQEQELNLKAKFSESTNPESEIAKTEEV